MIANIPLGDVVVWFGALANLVLAVPTVLATARGDRRPSRVSFLLWTTQAAIAFAASAAAGAGLGALLVSGVAAAVLGTILLATFVAALRGRPCAGPAGGGQAWVDRLCLTVCALALFGWWLTHNPVIALALAIVTHAVAAVPTCVRAWRGAEPWLPYLGFAVNAGCAFLVITDWSPADWAFTYYQLVVSVLLTVVSLVRTTPASGAHRLPAANRAWARTLAAGGAVVAVLVASGVVAGLLPRPGTEAAPALMANPGVLPAPDTGAVPVPATGLPTVRARVTVPRSPGDIAMAPNGRFALIAHGTRMAVSVLDTRLGQVTATIPTPQAPPRFVTFCGRMAYLSMFDDPADRTGGDRHLVGVLDTTTNAVVTTIPMSTRPFAAACSPNGTQLWVPRRDDGRVDVVDTGTNQVIRSVPVPAGPHRLVFSPDGTAVYAVCRDADVVAVLDPATSTVVRTVAVGAAPQGGALSPDGTTLAVVDSGSAQVSVVDTARAAEVRRLPTGENPQEVAWSADGRVVYTANADGRVNGRPVGTLSVIDVATGGQSRLVTDGPDTDSAPTGIARSADGATGYVTNLRSGTVTVYALGR